MSKPRIITSIEQLLGITLHPAPERGGNQLNSVFPYKKDTPKYAMEGDKLVGLNLANIGLTDTMWKQLTELADFHPHDLQVLNVSDNELKEFRLPDGMINLKRLNIEDNALSFPPEEILRQGNDLGDGPVLRFLLEILTKGEADVYEVKMLILGEGETGKTTFWNKLQNPDYPVPLPLDKQPSTVGIEIKEGWEFEHLDHSGVPFLVNLWDFGGQPIQHMTHQFFLTRRSFYVLMADARRNIANFPYWFKIINLLGCDPDREESIPVLVIFNKKGVTNPSLPYDPEDAKTAFPKLRLINYEVDFAKMDFQLKNLPAAIHDILCHEMSHLPLKIPESWNTVRKALYALREEQDHISFTAFADICKGNGIEDKHKMLDLSQLLHDLGVILHHQDDLRLRNFIVLNPDWALNAVYEILKHEEVGKNQGRFTQQLLSKVWDAGGYNEEEQMNLMNLMLKDSFEVCFEAEEERQKMYIAPQLLPDFRPVFEWEQKPHTLRYTYQYPFMPKGLIGRLMVRVHDKLKSLEGKKLVWVKGMLLTQDGCEALVIETEDKATGGKIIQIEIHGDKAEDRRFLLRTIRNELGTIHERSFPSLKFYEKIPCCCSECIHSDSPYFYNREELERRKSKGKLTVECGKSFEDVSVRTLLEGVYGEEQRDILHPIKQTLTEGNLQKALTELLKIADSTKENEVLGLHARLSKLKREMGQGTIAHASEAERNEWNRIMQTALRICDEIKPNKLH